jgi:predicted Zn-ribbon and HTH transcriptional regulator
MEDVEVAMNTAQDQRRGDQLRRIAETISKDGQSMSVRCARCRWKYRRPFAQKRIFCRVCESRPWHNFGSTFRK